MSEQSTNKEALSRFLRDMADEIDSDRISAEDMRIIGEIQLRIEGAKELEDLDEDTIRKYLFTGWWIHRHLTAS